MTTATPRTPAPRPASRRGRVVLGPLSAVLVLGALLAAVAAVVAGSAALLGVLVGTVLVAVVFAFGAVVVGAVALVSPGASLLVALLTYTLQVVAVGVFYVGLSSSGALGGDVDARWLSAAVIVGTLAWTTTQIVVTVRSRQPAYDLPSEPPAQPPAQPPARGSEASVR